jgi:hypothetical protein
MRELIARGGLATLAILATLAGGCKNKDGSTPAADSSQIGVDNAVLRVTEVELGRSIGPDKRVTDDIEEFAATDTIYASVQTTGSGSGTLVAHWSFEDGQVVEQSEQSVATTGPAVTEFHISKPTPWPAGKYKVTISLNGQEVDSEEFSVK